MKNKKRGKNKGKGKNILKQVKRFFFLSIYPHGWMEEKNYGWTRKKLIEITKLTV